ncbi:type IV secretion system protein [Streptobacillus felis]|uniref:type IV secretion system protein n=1 Tax=Streptobacillus felis TaxID=1384509 RepID=UPI00082EA554|nr:type IV secretion system protein [Streptobacillus felis]
MINNFVQIFADMLSNGVLKTVNIVLGIMSIIAAIDFVLSFIFEYAADFMSFVKVFLTKIFKYAIFFVIAKLYVPITDEFVNIIFRVGYLFFPEGKTPSGKIGLPNFDEIYEFLFSGITRIRGDWAKLSWYQMGAQLVYVIIVIVAFIAIFLIIKEIIVNFVEIKITIALGVLLLPFNVFEYTRSMGAKLWNALLNSAGKLLVAISLTGVTLQILQNNIFESNGEVEIGNALAWTFLLGLCAYLVTNSRELGGMLINGTGSGNANNIIGQAMGLAVGGALGAVGGAVVGGSAMRGALAKGTLAAKGGKNFRGIMKAAREGMKEGAAIAKSSRIAKVGSKLARGAQNTVGYATGNRSVMNAMSDIWGATAGTISDQIMHDGEKLAQNKENMLFDDPGEAKDYVNSYQRVKDAIKEARNSFNKPNEVGEMPRGNLQKYREAFKEFRKQMNDPKAKDRAFEKASRIAKEKREIHNTRKEYMDERRYNPNTFSKDGRRVKKDIWNEEIGKDILEKRRSESNSKYNNKEQNEINDEKY